MRRALTLLPLAMLFATTTANAANVPVMTAAIPPGGGAITPLRAAHDPGRTVDGNFSDWTGRLPGFGGAEYYSHGELVYEDHIWDAWGPDNGQDYDRFQVEDPLQAAVPETYRIDPALEYAPGEFGVPTGPFTFDVHYGDLPHQDQADLSEVRLGTDANSNLWLLARTTTMNDAKPATALLVLLDTKPGSTSHAIGFGSNLSSSKADYALFLHGDQGQVQDLATGAVSPLPSGSVATNPTGYDNAVEARIPASLLNGDASPGVAVAAGIANAAGNGFAAISPSGEPNIANVAFRTQEPARDYWDKQQALDLYQGTIDPFFTTADLNAMRDGRNEAYRPTAGFHDRIFESSPTISSEGGHNGILQRYGLYIPTSYSPSRPNPVQWWFHFRGGNADVSSAVVPGVVQQMGEDANSLVVTPDGRGDSSWYVGKGQVDFLEVWDDVHKLLNIDRNREYIAGHSMGGWASWLLPVLYPDRWAAAFPASGPPTQGAWLGCSDPNCYIEANGGNSHDELTYPLLENLKWIPYVNYQGTEDELVPVTGPTTQMQRMHDLGFRYRYYLFPHEEHYGPPVFDQWAEGVKYEHQFVRNPNPPSLTYIRSMPMEHAVETVSSDGVKLNFDFDHAYWMSGLEPVDPARGIARVDARSLAIPEDTHDVVPDIVPPVSADQTDPSVEEGQAWVTHPGTAPATKNGFTATLSGASAVTFDLRRMRISRFAPISADITTDHELTLTLVSGKWSKVIDVPAGHHVLTI